MVMALTMRWKRLQALTLKTVIPMAMVSVTLLSFSRAPIPWAALIVMAMVWPIWSRVFWAQTRGTLIPMATASLIRRK